MFVDKESDFQRKSKEAEGLIRPSPPDPILRVLIMFILKNSGGRDRFEQRVKESEHESRRCAVLTFLTDVAKVGRITLL